MWREKVKGECEEIKLLESSEKIYNRKQKERERVERKCRKK